MTKNGYTAYKIFYYAGANGQPKITLHNYLTAAAYPGGYGPEFPVNAARLVFHPTNVIVPANSVTSEGEIVLNYPVSRFLDVLKIIADKVYNADCKETMFVRCVVLEDNGQGYLYTENLCWV